MTTFEEVLKSTGRLAYTNKGISMMPLIREDRDVLVIKTIDRPLKKYDAVLFIRPGVEGRGKYVLHRIMKDYKDGTFFIIGDNCTSGERVARENIIGILTNLKRDDKLIDCFSRSHMIYVKLWWFIYPLRRVYKKTRGILGRIKRKLL